MAQEVLFCDFFRRRVIVLSAKTGKTVKREVGFKLAHSFEKEVEAEVKFLLVDEKWVGDVLLNYVVLGLNFVDCVSVVTLLAKFLSKKDANSTCTF